MNDSNVKRPIVTKVVVKVKGPIVDPPRWLTEIKMLSDSNIAAWNFSYYPKLKFDSGFEYDTRDMDPKYSDNSVIYTVIGNLGMDNPNCERVLVDVERDGNTDNAEFIFNLEHF